MDIPLIRLSLNLPAIPDGNMPLTLEFMQLLNVILSGQSTLNYHLIPITNRPFIYIPVFPYNRAEFTDDIEPLIKERIKLLKSFISTYDFSNERKVVKWNLRNMLIMRSISGNDNRPLFKIENRETGTNETVDISKNIKLEYPKMKRYKLVDNSYISVFMDPYGTDEFLLLANLSKPFSEMRYQYNALHLYEHLMTYAWKNTDHDDETYMNGLTVVNGISNIYSILNNTETLLKYMDMYITFVLKARDRQFWIDNKEMLRTETIRTISETRMARSFSSPSRSDPVAYDCNYNIDVFCKWSNEPFDLLITTNTDLKIDIDKINAKILSAKRTDIKLSTPTGSYIPVEALIDKTVVRIIKEEPSKIIETLWDQSFGNIEGHLYGIDNCMLFPSNYNIEFSYYLHGLVYLHRFVKNIEEYDNKFARTLLLPRDFKKTL